MLAVVKHTHTSTRRKKKVEWKLQLQLKQINEEKTLTRTHTGTQTSWILAEAQNKNKKEDQKWTHIQTNDNIVEIIRTIWASDNQHTQKNSEPKRQRDREIAFFLQLRWNFPCFQILLLVPFVAFATDKNTRTHIYTAPKKTRAAKLNWLKCFKPRAAFRCVFHFYTALSLC